MFTSSSVIIPVKNVAPWISEALASVDDIPGMSTEIVVVDDGSTDGTREIIENCDDPRVRLIDNAGTGPGDGRNTGLSVASGEILFALDGDDRFVPGSRAKLARRLADAPQFAAVAGSYRFMDEHGRLLTHGDLRRDEKVFTDELRIGAQSTLSTFAFRTSVVRQLGWARNFFVVSEDHDFIFRLSERHDVLFHPVVVCEIRFRSGSLGRSHPRAKAAWYKDVARSFLVQRQENGQDDLMRGQPPEVPVFPAEADETPDEIAVRMILGEAWQLHAAGRMSDARGSLFRAFSCASYLKYAMRPGLRLGLVLLRDRIVGRGTPTA